MPVDWETRVGGAAGDNYWPISEVDKLLHCQSAGAVLDLAGWSYLTGGEGGGAEEGGGGKTGEGAEGGAESAVDGKCARARLGKKGQLSYKGVTEALNVIQFAVFILVQAFVVAIWQCFARSTILFCDV